MTVDLSDGDAQNTGVTGTDTLSGFFNLTGGDGHDTLTGNELANVIKGGLGNDTIQGGDGNDTLDGGSGAAANTGGSDTVDYSYISSSSVNLAVTLGLLTAGTGAVAATKTSGVAGDIDTISNFENVTGGSGNDVIIGNAGVNTLKGGEGDDIIQGGAGSDVLDGEAGVDTVDYSYLGAAAGITLTLPPSGAQSGTVAGDQDSIADFENVIGGKGNDHLSGNDQNNTLTGGAGDDHLFGGVGDDTLIGGAGNDELDGGEDSGTSDIADYSASGAAVTVNLSDATVTLALGVTMGPSAGKGGDAQGDTFADIEDVIGSNFNDILIGDNRSGKVNILSGGKGNDLVFGSAGIDDLRGGEGTGDTLSYATDTAGVTLSLQTGIGTGLGNAAGDAFEDFEN